LLNRWGHTSNVYEEKIYFFGGRASTNKDHNDIFIYDPKENLFIQPNIENNNRPKERRRHSSAIIGNSLIIFAGFNGKYLRDFHYLTIKS
jgi:N-acetylneuraminic acid mutarotase